MSSRGVVIVVLFLAAVAVVVAAGYYGWIGIVISYMGATDSLPLPMMMGVGFLAGVLSFFAPCAFALFPGYVSFCLARTGDEQKASNKIWRPGLMGASCGLGAIAFFALVGVSVWILGGSISRYLINVKPIVALFILAMGILLLTDVSPGLSGITNLLPGGIWRRNEKGALSVGGFFLYGFGYGLASTGCSFPVFLSLIIIPVTTGRIMIGFLTFLSFSAAMWLFMIVATMLIGLSRDALIRRLSASTLLIKKIGGIILILAGIYLGYYFIRAGM